NDRTPAAHHRRLERSLGFAQRTGLVRLDQNRVAGADRLAVADTIGIGDEVVVADDLKRGTNRRGERDQAGFVVFAKRILDRDDRVAPGPADQHVDQFVAIEFTGFAAKAIAPAATEFRSGDVERDRDVLAGPEAGPFDRRD